MNRRQTKLMTRAFLGLFGLLLLVWALVLACSSRAHAGEWELSAGITQAQHTKPGTWYQPGLPYHLHMRSPAFGIDYRQPITSDWSMVYGFERLGRFSFSAEWVPDPLYNVSTHTANTSMGISHARGYGSVEGIYIAPEYTMHLHHGVTEDIMAGLWAYDSSMSVTVPDNIVYPTGQRIVSNVTAHNPIHVSFMGAIQINVDRVGMRFSVFDARAYERTNNPVPGIYDGFAGNASLVWRLP